MGKLLLVEKSNYVEIPTPYNSHPDDKFAVVELDPEVYFGFLRGSVAVITEGVTINCFPHAIDTSIGVIIARLTFIDSEMVKVESFCVDYPSHTARRDHLTIIGSVCEIYPQGMTGTRWILWEESMGVHNAHALDTSPLLEITR